MSVGELAVRGRQEATKWLDRIGPADGRVRRSRPIGPRHRSSSTAFSSFFDGASDERVPALVSARMPESRDAILGAAESILEGRFDLLGYRGLWFGRPIDWHREPLSGRRAPRLHWSRLDPLDAEQMGDSKVLWELGRMQWLVTLAQAYRLSGDERFAVGFVTSVRDFLRANPPGIGIHWASSLECALRIVSWSWALALLRCSPKVTPDVTAEVLGSLESHARHIERYLSTSFSPNTHLTGEALGLFYAGVLLPCLARAPRWRTRGLQILVEESGRQILPDGIYFEQATCYQRYTVEIGLHLLLLGRRAGVAVPRAVGERLQRLLDALLVLRRPDGAMPSIGDADGGWLLPLSQRAPDDLRGVFAPAAVLFSRRDYAWAAGGPAPEVPWLLGAEALGRFDALSPAPPAGSPSRSFADGGYAVMATGWDRGAHQLVFDVGPLGCHFSSGHGHADLLAIQCTVFGEPYVVDPGTFVYTGDAAWRDYFRGTAAHATVLVDGIGQADPAGPFAWRDRPGARLKAWRSTEAIDFADAVHEAYLRLPSPVLHRRRVLFVKPRYWVIADDLLGEGEHRIELRFPFAPVPVTAGPGPWLRARGREGRGLWLRVFAAAALTVTIHEGEDHVGGGWISPDYGCRRPAPMVVHEITARLPLRFVTLLLPTEDASVPPPDLSAIADTAGQPEGVAFPWGESVSFAGESVVIGRSRGDREGVD
jgi:hypothetical protein